MSKLEQLIDELCPKGVPKVKLGEIAIIQRGGDFQKKDFVNEGYPCVHYGQIYTHYNLFANSTISFISEAKALKTRKASKNDIVMAVTSENIEDVCKCIAWLGDTEIAIGGHTAIIQHHQNPKYLSYFFHSNDFFRQKIKIAYGTKVIDVAPNRLKNIIIPLPPLPIQEEIVRILDTFTELTTELTAELTAELMAREKQHEYYREQLINELCRYGVEYKPIADYIAYKQPTKFIVKSTDYDDSFQIPVLTAGQTFILGYTNENFGIYDANQQNPVIIFDDFTTSSHWVDFKFKIKSSAMKLLTPKKPNLIVLKYFYHVMKSLNYQPDFSKHERQWISKFSKIKIPIPPLSEQQRIVSILDRFDTLVNDITSGLPAEIEARKKQYEYYRDKLLTFKEKEE